MLVAHPLQVVALVVAANLASLISVFAARVILVIGMLRDLRLKELLGMVMLALIVGMVRV